MLDQILSHAEQIAKPSIRNSILHNAERLRQNQKLIQLTGAAPLPFALKELQYTMNNLTTTEVLKAIHLR